MMIPFKSTSKAFTDLTGPFPSVSSRGNKYVLIAYDYDSNAILATPVKTRRAGEMTKAFKHLYNKLAKRGSAPKALILDNEISGELKRALDTYDLTYQLAPPPQHRRNAAERAIQTFKNHFIAGLCSTNPNYP